MAGQKVLIDKVSKSMHSILISLAKIGGGLVLLLFLTLWAGSYFVFDRVSIPLQGDHALVLISYRGSVSAVSLVRGLLMPEVWWEHGDVEVPANTYPDQIWPRKRLLGFGCITRTLYLNAPNSPVARDRQTNGLTGGSYGTAATGLIVPNWFLALLLLGAAAVPWRKPRFSLRFLLIVTTVTSLLLGVMTIANRAPLEKWKR
jgi:hypothetical protein